MGMGWNSGGAIRFGVVAFLVASLFLWMSPSGKANTNLIGNPGIEDPVDYSWAGGIVTTLTAYTGTHSLQLDQEWFECYQEIDNISSGTYYYSMMFKPSYNSITLLFTPEVSPESEIAFGVSLYNDVVTYSEGGVTNASVSVLSGGWRNIAFNVALDSYATLYLKIYRANGFIDDVWLSTSPSPNQTPPPPITPPVTPPSSESVVNLADFPQQLAVALTVSLFVGQLLASLIFMSLFLFPAILIAGYWGGAGGVLYSIIFVGLGSSGVCVALGWLPVWLYLVMSLLIALMFAGKMRELITGGPSKGD